MITLKVKDKVLDLDGEPIKMEDKEMTVGRVIALILLGQQDSSDPLRSYVLSLKIDGAKDTIEVDDSEKDFIEKAVKSNQQFNNLAKGVVLSLLKK